jgi:hypothetical protein
VSHLWDFVFKYVVMVSVAYQNLHKRVGSFMLVLLVALVL